MSKATFTPTENYNGPAIELVCGKHTKEGKFRPKNIKLTSISRLNKFERYVDRREGYIAAMQRKDPSWTIEAAEQRWCEAGIAYYANVRELRIEARLNRVRKHTTINLLQFVLAA